MIQIHDVDVIQENNRIIARLFGRDENGFAHTLLVKRFKPYFYVAPKCSNNNVHFEARLQHILQKDLSFYRKFNTEIKAERWKTLYGYSEHKRLVYKITFANLYGKNEIIKRIESHFGEDYNDYFEANIDNTMQFMILSNIKGFDWVQFNSMMKSSPESSLSTVISSLDEIRVDNETVRCNALFKILSFDIEVEIRDNKFPEPDVDRIIVIACALQQQQQQKQRNDETCCEKFVFTLRSCASFSDDSIVLQCFETESTLLIAFTNFVKECDADIITGYNISGFDLNFVYKRCLILNLPESVFYIGKLNSKFCVNEISKTKLGTKFNVKKHYITFPGRVIFDVLPEIKNNFKLRCYKLNDVAKHFIRDQKDDVHFTEITPLFNGNDNDRRRLAEYCLKDAILPLQLINKLKLFTNAIEMCRVTGVSLQMLVNRGQQIKIMSQLLRECKVQQFLIPTTVRRSSKPNSQKSFSGALVIEPKTLYYTDPIVVLDFASLYPSIMIRHNLCYTTLLLTEEDVAKYSSNDYTRTETNACFLKQHIRQGLLPTILQNLLKERSKVKKQLAEETNVNLKQILDGKQLALKISANAVYGFTGAQHGFLPCLSISESVTTFGQVMLRDTKALVEFFFTRNNGYENDARVIYGDTDSVFINFGNVCLQRAKELGIEASNKVNYEPPIKLEFEKVYESLLLLKRKKYSGLIVTLGEPNGEIVSRKIDNKGIEICRRDNSMLLTDAQRVILHELLVNKSRENVYEYVKNLVDNVKNRISDYSLELLTISKELKKEPEEYKSMQPHTQLVLRMRNRGDLNTPNINERVPFVVVKNRNELSGRKKLSERVEHPEYYQNHTDTLMIDADYYLNNQLYLPLSKILHHVFSENDVNTLFQRTAKKRKTKCEDIREMMTMMKKRSKASL